MTDSLPKHVGVSFDITAKRWRAYHLKGGRKYFSTFEEAVAQRIAWEAEFGITQRGVKRGSKRPGIGGSKPGERRGALKNPGGGGRSPKRGAGVSKTLDGIWRASWGSGKSRLIKEFKTEEEARAQRLQWETEYLAKS